MRRILPRFQPENFENNLKLVHEVERIAQQKGCTPAQLALNWVRSLSKRPGMPVIIPVPGATTAEKVKENAVVVELSEEEMEEIGEVLKSCVVVGDRYHEFGMKLVNG